MFSTADTPASRSPSPESAKERTTPGISGLSSPDSFAYYDPESSSLRTSQATFDLGFTPSLPTLPAWGWMSGGELYERQTWGHPIKGPDSLSSQLQTPTTGSNRKSEKAMRSSTYGGYSSPPGLEDQVRALLPTPTAQTGGDGERPDGFRRLLAPELRRTLLPTPTGDDANNVTRESGDFQSLAREVHNLLPTPTTQDGENNAGPSQHRRNSKPLNVVAVDMTKNCPYCAPDEMCAVCLGVSTAPPSNGGSRSQAGLPPGQLTLEDA